MFNIFYNIRFIEANHLKCLEHQSDIQSDLTLKKNHKIITISKDFNKILENLY